MLTPEELIDALAALALPSFPKAMAHPLVAAGIIKAGDTAFSAVGTNVMLLQGSEYKVVHAEEMAIRAFATEPSCEIDVVVTLEPCEERDDLKVSSNITSCSQRIIELSTTHQIRRVIVGWLDNGLGLPLLLEKGLSVILLDGTEHRQTALKPEARTHLDTYKKALTIREIPQLDALNRNSLARHHAIEQENQAEVASIIECAKSAIVASLDPVEEIAKNFPHLLRLKDPQSRKALEKRLERARRARPPVPLDSFAPLRELLYNYVDAARWKQHRVETEQELRKREDTHVPQK